MELNEGQIAEFDERGYLFLPKLLDDDEAACLQAAMPDVLNREGPEVGAGEARSRCGASGLWGPRVLRTVPGSIAATPPREPHSPAVAGTTCTYTKAVSTPNPGSGRELRGIGTRISAHGTSRMGCRSRGA